MQSHGEPAITAVLSRLNTALNSLKTGLDEISLEGLYSKLGLKRNKEILTAETLGRLSFGSRGHPQFKKKLK